MKFRNINDRKKGKCEEKTLTAEKLVKDDVRLAHKDGCQRVHSKVLSKINS